MPPSKSSSIHCRLKLTLSLPSSCGEPLPAMTAIRGTPAQGPRPACPRLSAATTAPTPYLRHAHPLPTPCSHPVHSLPTLCPHSTHTAHTLPMPFPHPTPTLVLSAPPCPHLAHALPSSACPHLSPVAHILKHVVAHTPTRPQPRQSSALPHGLPPQRTHRHSSVGRQTRASVFGAAAAQGCEGWTCRCPLEGA